MPTYSSFEELPVWQAASDLAAEVIDWTQDPVFAHKADVADQLSRACLSISNNIAEGFERGSTADLIKFLYYARGSAGESRSVLRVVKKSQCLAPSHSRAEASIARLLDISRQLRGWLDSLQNSEIRGQRYLNNHSRKQYSRRIRRSEFLDSLDESKRQLEQRLKADAARRAEERV